MIRHQSEVPHQALTQILTHDDLTYRFRPGRGSGYGRGFQATSGRPEERSEIPEARKPGQTKEERCRLHRHSSSGNGESNRTRKNQIFETIYGNRNSRSKKNGASFQEHYALTRSGCEEKSYRAEWFPGGEQDPTPD
ncbi:hypothetical protein TWF788_008096 [Orbilia oligospora]|uniref:Uncharacterized protein n=1 Tax=Orbilia oligospora TaxID=2813651 RepID=A0A7C8Q369_ORBOL|nr:hypothetical protein TWF788_008096 [Orbilia oligospora]